MTSQIPQFMEDRVMDQVRLPDADEFVGTLEEIIVESGVPALGVALVTSEKYSSWVSVAGRRRINSPDPVTAADKFHLGSCGKSMTATIAALLVEEGVLRWNSTIGELTDATKIHPDYLPVTVEQLLCHRAGTPGDFNADGLRMKLLNHTGTPREQRVYLMEQVLSRPPVVVPSTQYLYSNAGYAITGGLIEELLDEPWESCIQRLLFQPLGMTSAGFGAPATPGMNDQPFGHRVMPDGTIKPVERGLGDDNPSSIAPSGKIHCSLEDWCRYAYVHLTGRTPEGDLFLQLETLKKLHTPDVDPDYAYGWGITKRSWAGGNVLMHNGSNTMFYSIIWVAPNRGFAVMSVTNIRGEQGPIACDRAVSKLIEDYLQ